MKILILRFSSIGDIVLTTPVVRALKVQLEEAQVHYCTKPAFKTMLENNSYVDKVLILDGSLGELIRQIKAEKYDYIIDLHNNLRTRIIKWRTGVNSYSFNKLNWEKWLLVNFKINLLPNVHIVDRYMETVAPLGVKTDALGLDYFIPEKDEMPLDWLPESHRSEFVVYAIGGQHETKKLPFKRMVELCDKINKPIVLLGGKEDAETGDKLVQFFEQHEGSASYEEGLRDMGKKAVIFNACGKCNLNQSASLTRQAKYVFTHDTGMMHIAAALKKPVFSIWGNTVPEFGMYPYRTQFTVLEKKGLSCRPCSKIGHGTCPKAHFDCMNKIVFDFYLP
jgi:ADP-heptose:LPS heptosyltransferase